MSGATARWAGGGRAGVDPREGDACCAALRGGRHQGEGIVQQRVHLLPRLLDGGLWGHVGGWGRGVAGRRRRGTQEDIVRGGGAPVWGSLALVRVRLETYFQAVRDMIWSF